jgi:hypothetical protein
VEFGWTEVSWKRLRVCKTDMTTIIIENTITGRIMTMMMIIITGENTRKRASLGTCLTLTD